MVKIVMIMHHTILCTPCIALFNCGHLLHIRVDHVEPKTDNEAEQVQWVFGTHKRQVLRILTFLRIKASLSASYQSRCVLYLNFIYNTTCLCIKFIGVG
jgi:hypothetical protein